MRHVLVSHPDWFSSLAGSSSAFGLRFAGALLPGFGWFEQDGGHRLLWDHPFACQILPDAEAFSGESIQDLGRQCLDHAVSKVQAAVETMPQASPRPLSLLLHCFAPGVLQLQHAPAFGRRAQLLFDFVHQNMRRSDIGKAFRFHRPDKGDPPVPDLLLQIGLTGPASCVAAVCSPMQHPACRDVSVGSWPVLHPGGVLAVSNFPQAPGSTFRKLEDAFNMMQMWPSATDAVCDLGASPGAFSALCALKYKCKHVLAIDRAPLDPSLLKEPSIRYERADAEAFMPTGHFDWLLNDVVCYPDKTVRIFHRWLEHHPELRFVVGHIKFQGDPSLPVHTDSIWELYDLFRAHGFHVRIKHLFNDKNEATVMAQRRAEYQPLD